MATHHNRANSKRKYFMLELERIRPGGPGEGSYCPEPCGKMRYSSRKSAKRAARAMRSDGRHEVKTMHVYPCDLDDQYFHLTSMPADKVESIRERKTA